MWFYYTEFAIWDLVMNLYYILSFLIWANWDYYQKRRRLYSNIILFILQGHEILNTKKVYVSFPFFPQGYRSFFLTLTLLQITLYKYHKRYFLPQHLLILSLSGEYLLINGYIYLVPKVVVWWWRKEANALASGNQCIDIQTLVDVLFLISQSIFKLKESDITYTFNSGSSPKCLDFIMLALTNASSSLWERRKASSDSLLMLDLGDRQFT